jgi:CelD/BcsL family acetyltransferase involved in cellulose biosynthesis
MMQAEDAEFYTLVQTDALGQPDVRELFRDLTNRRAAKMKKYNL